jgi:hypothetical protein
LCGPWIRYWYQKSKWCQPDALAFLPKEKTIIVVEVKLKHCFEAWEKSTGVYKPLVEWMFPGWKVRCVEIVRWFDGTVRLPVRVDMLPRVELVGENYGVHIWNPNRNF